MADISKVKIENNTYNIKDEQARNQLSVINYNGHIMIGDSYGQGITNGGTVTGWCDRVKTLLNLSNEDYYKFVEGGIGFVNYGNSGHNFLSLLQDNISQITDKNKIIKIIVCGGHNDRDYTSSQINNAINGFITYCNSNFPNAKVYIGMVGNSGQNNSTGSGIRQNIVNNVLRAYQNCVVYGGLYLNGIENILHDYINFMSADNVHPTELGYQFMSAYIYNALLTGYADYVSQINGSTAKNITDSAASSSFEIYTRLVNNIVEFSIPESNINFSTSKSATDIIDLGTIELAFFRATRNICIPVHFYCVCTSGNSTTYYGTTGLLKLSSNGHLYLQIDILPNNGSGFITISNITQIHFRDASYTAPTTAG